MKHTTFKNVVDAYESMDKIIILDCDNLEFRNEIRRGLQKASKLKLLVKDNEVIKIS